MKQTHLWDAVLREWAENKVPVTLFLVQGIQIRGRIENFNQYEVEVHTVSGQRKVINKEDISMIQPERLSMNVDIHTVDFNTEQIEQIKQLWLEYADRYSNFDLRSLFQDLNTLPQPFIPPNGTLILACIRGEAVGCVALRKENNETAELVRLYVQPTYRRRGIGRMLVRQLISKAREEGYQSILLYTVPSVLKEAHHLYQSFGFQKVGSHYEAQIPGDVFHMRLALNHASICGID